MFSSIANQEVAQEMSLESTQEAIYLLCKNIIYIYIHTIFAQFASNYFKELLGGPPFVEDMARCSAANKIVDRAARHC